MFDDGDDMTSEAASQFEQLIDQEGYLVLVPFEQLVDQDGYLVLIPAARVAALLARGITSITSTISLIPTQPPREGLTLIEAGKVLAEGAGPKPWIDPNSVEVWRMA